MSADCSGADCTHPDCVAKRTGLTRDQVKRQQFNMRYGASARVLAQFDTVAQAQSLLKGHELKPTPAMLPAPPEGLKVGTLLVGADGKAYKVVKETTEHEAGKVEHAKPEHEIVPPPAHNYGKCRLCGLKHFPKRRKKKQNGHVAKGTIPRQTQWRIKNEAPEDKKP